MSEKAPRAQKRELTAEEKEAFWKKGLWPSLAIALGLTIATIASNYEGLTLGDPLYVDMDKNGMPELLEAIRKAQGDGGSFPFKYESRSGNAHFNRDGLIEFHVTGGSTDKIGGFYENLVIGPDGRVYEYTDGKTAFGDNGDGVVFTNGARGINEKDKLNALLQSIKEGKIVPMLGEFLRRDSILRSVKK